MTVKNILPALLLTACGLGAFAQDPPPPATISTTNRDELLRRALEKHYAAQSNAPAAPAAATPAAAAPAGDPAVRPARSPFNRLPGRRPGAGNPPLAGAVPAAAAEPVEAAVVPPSGTPAPGGLEGGAVLVTASPATAISDPDKIMPARSIDFTAAPLEQVLEIYAEYVGRNLLRPATLPKAEIVLRKPRR